jgi:hypothetical protein
MRDLISNSTVVRGADQTLSGATPNNSALLDRRGYDGLAVYLQTGAVTVAGSTGFTMKLQHSDSTAAASFVDVPAAGVVPSNGGGVTVTATLDTQDNAIIGGVSYVGGMRYVRAVITGSTGTNAIVNVLACMGKPHRAPVAAVGVTTAAT